MVDDPIKKLEKCVDDNKNFIFTAGAGSGKTYSLIKVLEYANKKYSKELRVKNQSIACITYTNAGVEEIKARLPVNTQVKVCTIHELLWSLVKNYQKELKKELKIYFMENMSQYDSKQLSARKAETKEKYIELRDKFKMLYENFDYNETLITYQDKSNYKKNIISHDVLLKLSLKVLKGKENYLNIISKIYPYIYIDEYQDTFTEIAELFAEMSEYALIGFFGDPMQKIYDRGVGSLDVVCDGYRFEKVHSSVNRRSAVKVVNLINKIRTDTLEQEPMKQNEGSVEFYYVDNTNNAFQILEELTEEGYTEFQLLHKRIAERSGYLNLFEITKNLTDIDVLLNNSENRNISSMADMLFDIENYIIKPYNQNKKISLKRNLKKFKCEDLIVEEFIEKKNKMTFCEYCMYLYNHDLYFIEEDRYHRIILEEINEFKEQIVKKQIDDKLLLTELENFIFALTSQKIVTSHSTKGKEYENVVAIINEEDWNRKYKWSSYWQDSSMTPSQFINTSNLFYVICSRAIENLKIIYIDENKKLKNFDNLEEMFGIEYIKKEDV